MISSEVRKKVIREACENRLAALHTITSQDESIKQEIRELGRILHIFNGWEYDIE